MLAGATDEDIAKLMTTFDFEFEALSDDLSCPRCQSVLKDPCQVPCGCRFCRLCIEAMLAAGIQLCPGGSQRCGATALSRSLPDYNASKSISRLTATCPLAGCAHECPLADMAAHLRACPRRGADCPFRELGCGQGPIVCEEMRGHLQQEMGGHSEMLLAAVANIRRDIALLQSGGAARQEEVAALRRDLFQRTEQAVHADNENKVIRSEIRSLAAELESVKVSPHAIGANHDLLQRQAQLLAGRVEQVCEATREGETSGTATGSDQDAGGTRVGPAGEDIRSIKDEIDAVRRQLQALRVPVGIGRVDASCDEWPVDWDMARKSWGTGSLFGEPRTSDAFTGVVRPYKYQLAAANSAHSGALTVWLRILAGSADGLLEWSFRATVTVSVAHRDRRDASARQTRQCQLDRPPENGFSESDKFLFRHSELRAAGLDLARGARVSCQVVPTMG